MTIKTRKYFLNLACKYLEASRDMTWQDSTRQMFARLAIEAQIEASNAKR